MPTNNCSRKPWRATQHNCVLGGRPSEEQTTNHTKRPDVEAVCSTANLCQRNNRPDRSMPFFRVRSVGR
eukprot:8163406-Lingulodinium_polyedra.AAC.1